MRATLAFNDLILDAEFENDPLTVLHNIFGNIGNIKKYGYKTRT